MQVVLATWLLVEVLGPPALAGVAVLFAMVPILTYLSKQQADARRHHLKFTDERVRLCGEAARGMRGLKVRAETAEVGGVRRRAAAGASESRGGVETSSFGREPCASQ